MRSGRLRHRLTVQTANISQNAFGEPVQTWTTLATVWGAVEPSRGAERQRALQVSATEEVKIVLRYSATIGGIKPDDRILYGSKVYDISAVMNIDERNRELNVMAREHIDNAV